MVLEKTLESPLDHKEIQPVHSEGDQPWDFFGRNDAIKNSRANAGDIVLIPGLGRSPGEGNGYPLQSSGLEKPMDILPMKTQD